MGNSKHSNDNMGKSKTAQKKNSNKNSNKNDFN